MEDIEIVLSQVEFRLIALYIYNSRSCSCIESLLDNEIELYRAKTYMNMLNFRMLIIDRLLARIKSIEDRIHHKEDGGIRIFFENTGGNISWYDYKEDEAKDFDIGSISCTIHAAFSNERIFPSYGILGAVARILYDKNKIAVEAISLLVTPKLSKVEIQQDLQIDEPALLACFNAKFKGAGGNMNYTSNLIEDLRKKRDSKGFARIALLIQNSDCLITTWKREEFSKWHSQFCKVVGCKYVKYNPCKLRDDKYEKMEREFYYL